MKSPAHMYFVALVCPPLLNEKILRFKNWMKEQFGCVVALRSPAHITLVPPFWNKDAEEAALLEILHSFTTGAGEVVIQTNGFSHFSKKVLFIAVDDDPVLQIIKRQVDDHFIKSVSHIKKETRPFHPHITIANRDMKPSHFEKAWDHFSAKTFDEFFRTSTISLLKHTGEKWNVISERQW